MLNYIALGAALIVSSVAAWFSIVGLTAIFTGAFWSIIVMGSALEVAKVITAIWLNRYWAEIGRGIKAYLTFCVVLLMIITSIGIFGFLAKAHIDHQVVVSSGVSDQLKLVQFQYQNSHDKVADIDKQIGTIDLAVSTLTDLKRPKDALAASKKSNRADLLVQKETELKTLQELNGRKVALETQVKRLEAEVGPVKYVAELLFSNADPSQMERAVRAMIIILVLVFDPLAIFLAIGTNIRFKRPSFIRDNGKTIEIHKDALMKL